jgi:hypothetical protein
VLIVAILIFSGRCETPAGAAGQARPRRRKALRMLTACPAESEHPGAKNQLPNLIKPNIKKRLHCLFKNSGPSSLDNYNHSIHVTARNFFPLIVLFLLFDE